LFPAPVSALLDLAATGRAPTSTPGRPGAGQFTPRPGPARRFRCGTIGFWILDFGFWILEWSPDGRQILTASRDGTARQYVIDLDDLLQLAQQRLFRDFTPTERATYLGEVAPSPTAAATPPP